MSLIGSPLCPPYSPLQALSASRRDPEEARREMARAKAHMEFATKLGEAAMPNVFAKVVPNTVPEGSSSVPLEPLALRACVEAECFKSQAALLQVPFPYTQAQSQFWNEKCFTHFLRMVAMGIDHPYQNEVKAVCARSNGDFRSTSIKGFVRMINKLMSKNDHYYEAWPR